MSATHAARITAQVLWDYAAAHTTEPGTLGRNLLVFACTRAKKA